MLFHKFCLFHSLDKLSVPRLGLPSLGYWRRPRPDVSLGAWRRRQVPMRYLHISALQYGRWDYFHISALQYGRWDYLHIYQLFCTAGQITFTYFSSSIRQVRLPSHISSSLRQVRLPSHISFSVRQVRLHSHISSSVGLLIFN